MDARSTLIQAPIATHPTASLAEVREWVEGLPILATGWSPTLPVGPDDALLRLQAALWELAARPDAAALDPQAARAVAALPALVGADPLAFCRVAGRLIAYLELRTELG